MTYKKFSVSTTVNSGGSPILHASIHVAPLVADVTAQVWGVALQLPCVSPQQTVLSAVHKTSHVLAPDFSCKIKICTNFFWHKAVSNTY